MLISRHVDCWLRSPKAATQSIALGIAAALLGLIVPPLVDLSQRKFREAELQRRVDEAANLDVRFDENVQDSGCVALTLSLPARISSSQALPLEGTLTNRSSGSATVLLAGDGSWDRISVTPFLQFQFRAVGSKTWHEKGGMSRCGNASVPSDTAYRTLAQGESVKIRHSLGTFEPGHYQVRLKYVNDPNTERFDWPADMARLRSSTPCNLFSEVLELTVVAESSD